MKKQLHFWDIAKIKDASNLINMRRTLLSFVLSIASVDVGFSAVINILSNSSFEIEGDSTTNNYDLRAYPIIINGWQYDGDGRAARVDSGVNGFDPGDGSVYPGQFSTPFGSRWVFFGGGSADPGGFVAQDVSLSAGFYKASVWAKGYGASSEPVSLNLSLLSNNSGGAGAVISNSSWTISPDFGTWVEYSYIFQVTTAGNATFRIGDGTPFGGAPHADLHVDNAVLQLVPEPSALSLLAVGLGVALRRRRRIV